MCVCVCVYVYEYIVYKLVYMLYIYIMEEAWKKTRSMEKSMVHSK